MLEDAYKFLSQIKLDMLQLYTEDQ